MKTKTLISTDELEQLQAMQKQALKDGDWIQYHALDVAIYAGIDSKPLLEASLVRLARLVQETA